MSVVSERSATARRLQAAHQKPRPRPLGGRGRGYSHSDIGGPTGDPLIIPKFSAIASEGFKRPCPMDDWGENTTMVTGNTSEHSFLGAEENKAVDLPVGRMVVRRCSRVLWLSLASLVCLAALLSAPAMVAIPVGLHFLRDEWPPIVCELDCQGNLFDLFFRTLFLLIAQFAMYYRRATADMPRLYFARAAITLLVLFELFAFWLFYIVRILVEKEAKYLHVTYFALSLANALLFTHYLSCVILWFRHLRSEYTVTIVRDPDGESRTMTIGQMSIQEAAIEVLRFYSSHFPSYNVYLDKARHSSTSRMKSGMASGFKMYDIEGRGGHDTISETNARVLMEAMARRRMTGHSEMIQREQDWENRLLKRKFRLLASAEDAFQQVQPVYANHGGPKLGEMDLPKAAESVFSWINKPLTKFLKLTRLQERNSAEEIRDHIERCLAMKLNHRSFIQRFTGDRFPPKGLVEESKWSLSCGWAASAPVSHSLSFSLRCHDRTEDIGVQLVCTISALPFFNLTEQTINPPQKFTLRVSHDGMV